MLRLVCFMVCVGALFLSSICRDAAGASESERDLGVSKARNVARIIRPADVKTEELRGIQKVAIVYASNSQLMGQAVQDALMLKLRDAGLVVIEEARLSQATLAEISKYQEDAEKTPDVKKRQDSEVLNLVKIAKSLGLDAIIAGIVFEGRRQMSFPEQTPPAAMEKAVIATCEVQVISVASSRSVLGLLMEYDMGENMITVVDQTAQILSKELGR